MFSFQTATKLLGHNHLINGIAKSLIWPMSRVKKITEIFIPRVPRNEKKWETFGLEPRETILRADRKSFHPTKTLRTR